MDVLEHALDDFLNLDEKNNSLGNQTHKIGSQKLYHIEHEISKEILTIEEQVSYLNDKANKLYEELNEVDGARSIGDLDKDEIKEILNQFYLSLRGLQSMQHKIQSDIVEIEDMIYN